MVFNHTHVIYIILCIPGNHNGRSILFTPVSFSHTCTGVLAVLLTLLTLHAAPIADREKRNNIFRAGHVVGFNKNTYMTVASGRTAEKRNYTVLNNCSHNTTQHTFTYRV